MPRPQGRRGALLCSTPQVGAAPPLLWVGTAAHLVEGQVLLLRQDLVPQHQLHGGTGSWGEGEAQGQLEALVVVPPPPRCHRQRRQGIKWGWVRSPPPHAADRPHLILIQQLLLDYGADVQQGVARTARRRGVGD